MTNTYQDPAFVEALNKIASMTLWGEPIKDAALKQEYMEASEYDSEADVFNPSCDTESSMLTDAVEIAREAIAKAAQQEARGQKALALANAAPQLFEALEYFFNIMHDYRSSFEKGYVKVALHKARAALATAKQQ
jgi:hypothetical protein